MTLVKHVPPGKAKLGFALSRSTINVSGKRRVSLNSSMHSLSGAKSKPKRRNRHWRYRRKSLVGYNFNRK